MNCKVLVMSCDSYEDCWQPFFALKDKYWSDCPYDIYLGTETKDSKYAKVIKTQGSWTARLRKTLEQIDSEYVILLLDDFFFHKKVNQTLIDSLVAQFKPCMAVLNLERSYCSQNSKSTVNGFKLRENKEPYLNSCQPSIHNRLKLIERLQENQTPWQWELTTVDSPYDFYINTDELIFDIGYYENRKPWGIVQGKWATECIDLFKKENINIDFTKRGFIDMKLSIIIPFYKTLELTKELMKVLVPQLNKNVEVILVDDGCNEKELDKYPIKVIHKPNGGVSSARNSALDIAQGKYITFVDSDDMVTPNYIEKILEKCEEEFDYCFMSWESTLGKKYIITDMPSEENKCVWNCIYRRETIGKYRFDKNTQYGEEIEFNNRTRKGVKANITDILYIYNQGREESLTDLFVKGKITRDRPSKAQLAMFLRFVSKIGGVETFLWEFFQEYHDKYDILFLYEEADPAQIQRYRKLVKCERYFSQSIECETFLNVNCNKNIADKVTAFSGNYLDMAHTDYSAMGWKYTTHPKTTLTIAVSEVVKRALIKQYPKLNIKVIHNLIKNDNKRTIRKDKKLHFISPTRLSHEKGYERMKEFAKALNKNEVDFEWEVFTNDIPDEDIPNFVFKQPKLGIREEIAKADFLIQLSDTEADPYSPKEAFSIGVPVISTDFPSIYELGMKDGVNGFVLKMDLSNMQDVISRLKRLTFEPIKYDFASLWLPLLGKQQKSEYVWDGNESYIDKPDKWIALMQIRDEEDNIIQEGKEAKLYSSERIRTLLDHDMIKRKED